MANNEDIPLGSGKIQHKEPGFNSPGDSGQYAPIDETPLPVAESPNRGDEDDPASKITAFGERKAHADHWDRVPNHNGTGAIHVKTFHAKLTDDALRYMDQCVNEWLDAHPEYEVKFTNSTIGLLTGKSKEPHLICQIWV